MQRYTVHTQEASRSVQFLCLVEAQIYEKIERRTQIKEDKSHTTISVPRKSGFGYLGDKRTTDQV